MRFSNSVTVPKNVKGGTFRDFLTSIVLQNIETNEGGPLVQSKKFQKKSHSTEQKVGLRGILSVFLRFWTCFGFFLFVLDALLRFECFETP